MAPYTTEEYIEKAKTKHGDKYEYDRCVYIGSRTKVTVTCPTHGDFKVVGANHLSGGGCAKCAQESSKKNQGYTTETFIAKCKGKFGDKHDYTETIYVHSKEKIKIRCRDHGVFEIVANKYLMTGTGCQICQFATMVLTRSSMTIRGRIQNTEEYVEKAIEIHGDRYDYSHTIYCDSSTKVDVRCKIHGWFEISPNNHIDPKRKCGCLKCGIIQGAKKRSKGVDVFIEEARTVHGSRYSYDKVDYKSVNDDIEIICQVHGSFWQTPYHHLAHKCGCPGCGGTKAYTTETFVSQARLVQGALFDYSKVEYKTAHDRVEILCATHGVFEQTAFQHLRGNGCQKCWFAAGCSKIQIDWLELASLQIGRQIQHAKNGGEYKIPNSRFSADGYDPDTKTVYEFHGRYFHSDPRVHPADEWHRLLKCSHGENHQKTLDRERWIREQGYNLVVMHEYDWRIFIKKIKYIQKRFRTWRLHRV